MNQAMFAFLLGCPALFSIVNTISGAFTFREFTGIRPQHRLRLAGQVPTDGSRPHRPVAIHSGC